MGITQAEPETDEVVGNRISSDQDGSATETLSTDDIFHVLQTKRRRDVLRFLQEADGSVDMRELANAVAASEQETSVNSLSSSERQRVYISLYQSHLPKLDDLGVVTYHKNRGIVKPTDKVDIFGPYLDRTIDGDSSNEQQDPWPRRYGAGIIASIGLIGVVAVGIVPLPDIIVSVLIIVLISGITITHMRSTQQGRIPFDSISVNQSN